MACILYDWLLVISQEDDHCKEQPIFSMVIIARLRKLMTDDMIAVRQMFNFSCFGY